MRSIPMPRVVAVVVSYEPDRERLAALLQAMHPQVSHIVLLDNHSVHHPVDWITGLMLENVTWVQLETNLGVATAQNRGVEMACAQGADYILFSDQDSLPAPDMVARLLDVAELKLSTGCRLAAVGPRYFDAHQEALNPFVRVRGLRVKRFDCAEDDQVIEVDHLIASGSLIPMSALDAIGPMRDELFIDYVDTEWSLRAWHLGYRSFGVCGATMQHGLGDRPYRFFGRYVPIHSPLRHYYLFRNAVWLYRQGWIPLAWKVATAGRLVQKFVFFSLVPPGRLGQLNLMLRGLMDGLRGRMGHYVP
jgi:rhamnosyltransferase